MVPTHSLAMETSVGLILMTLTGIAGADPELAETSLRPQPETRVAAIINNNAGPTSMRTLRPLLVFVCSFEFMLALRWGKLTLVLICLRYCRKVCNKHVFL